VGLERVGLERSRCASGSTAPRSQSQVTARRKHLRGNHRCVGTEHHFRIARYLHGRSTVAPLACRCAAQRSFPGRVVAVENQHPARRELARALTGRRQRARCAWLR